LGKEKVLAAEHVWKCHVGGCGYSDFAAFETTQLTEMLKHLEKEHSLGRDKLDFSYMEVYLKT
jgi:hypothetical protein